MTSDAKAGWWVRVQPILNKELGWLGLPVPESAQKVIDRSGLPEEVRGLVSRVVRRTRLRRGEKREVARELCAHFRDGAEAGASEADLLRAFGNEKAAARLIGRAKRRNRGVLWKSWEMCRRAAAVTMGVFLGAYLIFAARLALSERKVSRDYLAEYNAPALAVPLEDRGWPILRAAYLGLEEHPFFVEEDGRTTDIFERTPGDKWWPQTTAYLDRIEPALEEFRRASRAKRLAYVAGYAADPELVEHDGGDPAEDQQPAHSGEMIDDLFVGVLLPQLGVVRRAALLLSLDARRVAYAGNGEHAVQDIIALRRFAVEASEFPVMIGGLVGVSIHMTAENLTGEILSKWPDCLSDSQLETLAHSSASMPPQMLMKNTLMGERASFHDLIQRVYTDDGQGDGLIDLHAPWALIGELSSEESSIWSVGARIPGLGPVAAMLMPSRKEMTEKIETIYLKMEQELNQPMWEWTENGVDAEIEEGMAHALNRVRYHMIWILLPAIGGVAEAQERGAQLQDAMQAAIALELYRRRTGGWPERLEQIVPRYLPSVPVDRFTGGAIGYALRDGKPVLYSVGIDRDDDGGRAPTTDHAVQEPWEVDRWVSLEELERLRRENPAQIPDGDWVLWPAPMCP